MSKGQRGNKEAKKPKQPKKAPGPSTPAPTGDVTMLRAAALQRPKR
jgi:hypothetical protein